MNEIAKEELELLGKRIINLNKEFENEHMKLLYMRNKSAGARARRTTTSVAKLHKQYRKMTVALCKKL